MKKIMENPQLNCEYCSLHDLKVKGTKAEFKCANNIDDLVSRFKCVTPCPEKATMTLKKVGIYTTDFKVVLFV
jgi:hypothetical protein